MTLPPPSSSAPSSHSSHSSPPPLPLRPRPVVLCILDGFGYRQEEDDNATQLAAMPVYNDAWHSCPHALLEASEEHVGLPKGQMGNSEVGHMNLGAGRVVYQDLPMIDRTVADGSLTTQPALQNFIKKLKDSGGACHLMGLVSTGGVHAHSAHITALARILAQEDIPVHIHAFLDGRDTPPQSGLSFLENLEKTLKRDQSGTLATLCGRYYAMDRDKRWERVQKAYDLITKGHGTKTNDPLAAIKESYDKGVTDEFLAPHCLEHYKGLQDGDGVLFANFRSDRAREILTALLDPNFDHFDRPHRPAIAAALGMVEYSAELNTLMDTIFPPKQITQSFGEILAQAGLRQLRIAETEKYPHVTFFFNGGREEPYPNEDRILVPSPKVATYDLEPAMSAIAVTDRVVEAIESSAYDAIILNYANPDMVGHTGSLPAAIAALETIDACLARVFKAIKASGGTILLTADHGNCEVMKDPATQGPHTAHTLNKVPVLLYNAPDGIGGLRNGKLADVAPTLLALLQLPKPALMDGDSLLVQA